MENRLGMLIRSIQLFVMLFWTLIFDVNTYENEQSKLIVVPIESISVFNNQIDCPKECLQDICLKSILFNKNCTKLIREPCDCCNVCLRNENEVCGGKYQMYGICEEGLICYQTEQKGICVKGKRKQRMRRLIF